MAFVPTEPGTDLARVYGCTCPAVRPVIHDDGTSSYETAPSCPIHREGCKREDHFDRERGAR